MALQLTFDGTPKLIRWSEESVRALADVALGRYQEFTASIQHAPSKRLTFWRIVFSLLSVQTTIEANTAAYQALKTLGIRALERLDVDAIGAVLESVREPKPVMYWKTKARFVSRFARQWRRYSDEFERNGDTDKVWAERLEAKVKGLGQAKARFTVALLCPVSADVCCVDTWMYRAFVGKPLGKAVKRRTYARIEARIRRMARECGVSTFTIQWMVWDGIRGWPEPHAVLREV